MSIPTPLPSSIRPPMSQLTGPFGRYNAHKVAHHLGISLRDLADILGRNSSTLSRTPEGVELQAGLAPIIALLDLLHSTGAGEDAVRAWLRSPIPALQYDVPLELLKTGRIAQIRAALERAIAGDPA